MHAREGGGGVPSGYTACLHLRSSYGTYLYLCTFHTHAPRSSSSSSSSDRLTDQTTKDQNSQDRTCPIDDTRALPNCPLPVLVPPLRQSRFRQNGLADILRIMHIMRSCTYRGTGLVAKRQLLRQASQTRQPRQARAKLGVRRSGAPRNTLAPARTTHL